MKNGKLEPDDALVNDLFKGKHQQQRSISLGLKFNHKIILILIS